MYFSEFYSSIDEIEEEFKTDMSDLCSQDLPSLDYLKFYDKSSELKVGYYLIFEKGTNSPLGFIRTNIKEITSNIDPQKRKKFFEKFLKKPKTETSLYFQIPSVSECSFYCRPHHQKTILKYLETIIKTQRHQTGLKDIQINFTTDQALDFNFKYTSITWDKPVTLIKPHKNFKVYLKEQGLPESLEEKSSLIVEIKDKENISNFENHILIENIINRNPSNDSIQYLIVRSEKEIHHMGILFQGKGSVLFCKLFFNLGNRSFGKEDYLILNTIKEFYNRDSFKLKLINSSSWPEHIKRSCYEKGFQNYQGKTCILKPLKKSKKKKDAPLRLDIHEGSL